MTVQLLNGDCREVLRAMDENSVDAVVTDPPYDLTANKKGGTGPASVNLNSPYGRARITTGFMGKIWDGTGVAFDPVTWVEVLRVLKPGGHLLAFGGTRTYHRMACAAEDAGFEIRDQIQWLFGSGFPKSLDVERAIDTSLCILPGRHYWSDASLPQGDRTQPDDHICPSTWQGKEHEGEGTALKPAHEPIVVARKPLISTVAENVLQHGCGSLQIDKCRVEGAEGNGHWSGDDGSDATSRPGYEGGFTKGGKATRPLRVTAPLRDDYNYSGSALEGRVDGSLQTSKAMGETTLGRWPANVIHDGSDEVVSLFPSEAGAAAPVFQRNGDKFRNAYGTFLGNIDEQGSTFHGDSGSAARFFYCAKASQQDRDEGLEEFIRRQRDESRKAGNPGGDNPRNRGLSPRANHHPTVKPTDLMRYLCRLVTRPGGIVLDPFMGSGSTGKAAVLEGLSFTGVEQDPDYMEIARYRIDAAGRQGQLF